MRRILKLLLREMFSAAIYVLMEELGNHSETIEELLARAPGWVRSSATPIVQRWGHYEAPRA